jgi:hypothetical protein
MPLNTDRSERVSPDRLERRIIPRDLARPLRTLARQIAALAQSSFDPGLPAQIEAGAGELPAELSEILTVPGDAGSTVIDGLTVSDQRLGPTPAGWQHAGSRGLEWDVTLMLLGRCIGEPFGWQGQQTGRIVNNVVPTAGHEHEQTGASSATPLCPHTEDAFHPRRANLLLLACLRNPDRVGTTLSSIRYVRLDDVQRRVLAAPTLPILPDISYGAVRAGADASTVSTLWSGESGLTLRYDPAYTPLPEARAEFRSAYAHLTSELERVSVTVALRPGQLLLVDNDVAVHGRAPFAARYDGTDRWLKRVNIRVPGRLRNPGEASEDGYGQRLVEPFTEMAITR